MNDNSLSLADFYKLLYEKRWSTFFLFIVTFVSVSLIAFVLPKKYKSTAIINVYSSYFKNPMVREIIPELHAQDEIRYNVFAIIKNSINDDFLNEIGSKYKVYKNPLGSSKQIEEMNLIRNKGIDIITLGPQTFKISFVSGDPVLAKNITQDAVNKIISELKRSRGETINDLMDAMKKRIEILNLTNDDQTSPIVSQSPDLIKEELSRVRRSLQALEREYSSAHPLVVNLHARKKILEKWVDKKDISDEEREKVPVLGKKSKAIINDLLKDFLKKYNYLRVSYDVENKKNPDYLSITQKPSIPHTPFWPKKMVFYAIGVILGSILALLNIFISQVLKETSESLTKRLETQLDTRYLGAMPHFHEYLVSSSKEDGSAIRKGPDGTIKWN